MPATPSASGRYAGPLLGGLSAVLFAAHIMLSKQVGQFFSSLQNLAYQRLTTVVALAPFAWRDAADLLPQQLTYVLAGGALITGAAGVLFFAGLARCRADQASALTLLEPLCATIIGWAAFGETLGPLGCLGMALVLLSIYVVLRDDGSHAPPPNIAELSAR